LFRLCDMFVVPAGCDGKKKLATLLANQLPTHVLELPSHKDSERSRQLWLDEIKVLEFEIERLTGNRISRRSLLEAVNLSRRRTEVARWLLELRRNNPCPISGRDVLLVFQASFVDDVERWIERVEELCEELESTSNRMDGKRILLTGSPILFPGFKLLNIIEEAGATVVADELCGGTQRLYNPIVIDEKTEEAILAAIAERYLLPCTCPCFIGSDDRIDRLLELAEAFRINGVIHHTQRLCQLFDIECVTVENVFKRKGIPFLNIYSDLSPEDEGQIKTRVEAFLEMISSRRGSGATVT